MDKYVYHGSPNGELTILKPHKSTHLNNYVYATTNPIIALVFSINNNGDLDFDLRVVDDKVIFTERREKAFEIYKNSGYLYTLDSSNFRHLNNLWDNEVVSENDEKILSCEHVQNILEKFEEYVKEGKMIIYRYPDKPDFIPKDDSDLIDKYINFEKMGHKGAIDTLIFMFPHLKEKTFNKLETPSEFYYIDSKKDTFNSIVVNDNILDALLRNDSPVLVRDNGWLNYNVVDSKVVFEKGGFNLNEDFYIYKLKGEAKRLSAHSFKLDNAKIISCKKIDLSQYIADEKYGKTSNRKI